MSTETELEMNKSQLEAQVRGFGILGRALRAGSPTFELRDSLRNDYGYDTWPDNSLLAQYTEVLSEDVLSIERPDGRRGLVYVLCTGGPHCEIRTRKGGAEAICYGWFGADEITRELTKDELDGFVAVFGEDYWRA